VRHIFLISNDKTEKEKADAAEARIQEIYVRLQHGENFEQLARQFSDDKNTSENGGLLAPFGINTMMPEFEKASFELNRINDFSAPFKTSIGWHIVQLVEKKPIPPYAEAKADLEAKIRRDSRAAKGREVFVEKLKKEYKLVELPKRLNEIYAVTDESILTGTWDASRAAKLNKTLFSFNGIDVNQTEFVKYLNDNQKKGVQNTIPEQVVYKLYNQFVDQKLIAYEDSRLEEKYPDFKLLVDEYHDGILLFDLTQNKVWGKASVDTLGLEEFYNQNKNRYMWPMRAEAGIYSCQTEKIAAAVSKMASKGAAPADIEAKFNKDSKLNVVYESGKYIKGQNKAVDAASWQKGAVSNVSIDGRFVVVQVKDVLEPQPKELTEARGIIISDYQKYLEAEWIRELKSKYTVTINREAFDALQKELN
jgi:peptidyl-prolyl cis-trans isomerase SurA